MAHAGAGLGCSNKRFRSEVCFFRKERFLDISTRKGTGERMFLFALQRVWRVRGNFFSSLFFGIA